MNKDIWHKPSETTDVDNNLIIDDWTNGTYELGYFDDKDMIFRNFRNNDIHDEESMMRWCDVDELIDDYNRIRKALDIAVKRLGYIKNNYKSWTPDRDAQMIAQAANGLDEIKTALEQKDIK